MITAIKKFALSLAAMGLFMVPAVAPVAVSAQELGDCPGIEGCLRQGAEKTDPNNTGDASERVSTIIRLVINIFSLIVGVVAVIMIIIGGLKYITSGGDSGNVTGAKNTILYAVVGLIVVALAQILVRFVLQRATDAGA